MKISGTVKEVLALKGGIVRTFVLTLRRAGDILFAAKGRPCGFEWDENKNRQNLRKHDVRLETAALVFDDPRALARRDERYAEEERWLTIGAIGPGALLLVVHTWFERDNEEVIRIISARAAESHERRAYEEAYKGTETGHRGHRRKERPGH